MENSCETKASCMQKIIKKIKLTIPEIIGLSIGAACGFIYYKTVGCSTGTCPITSSPVISTVWGALIGYLFGSMFNKKIK